MNKEKEDSTIAFAIAGMLLGVAIAWQIIVGIVDWWIV